MRHYAAYLASLLALAVSACSGGCGVLAHPKITEQQIEKDIVGKKTGDVLSGWEFAKDEPREIKLLESDYSGDKATIVIDMTTESAPRRSTRHKMSGKLRLHYEWVAKEWALVHVENLTFKEE